MTEIKLGLTPAIISKYMIREWGIPFAREAMLSGRTVAPEELHRIGTVHGLANSLEGLKDLSAQYLRDLKQSAPRSATACKDLVRLAWRAPGSSEQAQYTSQVFEKMMRPGSEGEHGLNEFRRKVKGIDWGKFYAGKTMKSSA
jgi:hydroxymethylglutaryl-CoA lyase